MVNMALNDLNFRRTLCLSIIKAVSCIDDPRKESALVEYNRQLSEIDRMIEEITGKPPATVIGLKTAKLFPDSNLGG